jgi:hypothetical protein
MTDIPFYTKQDFVKLMRQKRGTEFTFGWLAMAYALPPVPEDAEQEIIRKEVPILQALPDYDGI